MERIIGAFTLIAVMAGITSGGMGAGLPYIDTEYNRLIRLQNKRPMDRRQHREKMSAGDSGTAIRSRHPPGGNPLSNLRVKRDSNRSGIMFDGVCMISILVVGLATVMGYSPSPTASVIAAFAFFLQAAVLLQYHVQTVLRLSR